MKTTYFFYVVALALFTAGAQAQNPDRPRPENPDRPRAEADKLFERAKQAKAEGRAEEADKLFDAAKRLQTEPRESADRGGDVEQRMRSRRAIELGKQNEAPRPERELGDRRDREHDGHDGPPPGDRGERMRHVTEAIGHLRAAGLNEPAEHLEQLARTMRAEPDQPPRGFGGPPPNDQMHAALREMHDNLQALRGEVQNMARAMEELRALVKKERNDPARERPAQ